MSDDELIYDFIILAVRDGVALDDPEVIKKLDLMAHRSIMGQYKNGMPKAVILEKIEWWMTSDWRDVEARQPDHDCPSCRAGNDQAIAFLKEHPDKQLALGNLRYVEVW